MSQHHALDQVEIGVTDFSAAQAFCGMAFGWSCTEHGPGPAYIGIRRDESGEGGEVGGSRPVDEVTPGGPLVLLCSEDLESSADAVRSAAENPAMMDA